MVRINYNLSMWIVIPLVIFASVLFLGSIGLQQVYAPSGFWSNGVLMNDLRSCTGGIEGDAASAIAGKIYVSHGYRCFDNAHLSLYDIATDTWTHGGVGLPDAPSSRAELVGASALGKHYAIGGRTGGSSSINEEFDPGTGLWTVKAPMPTARATEHSAVEVGGKIYVIGGRLDAAPGGNPVVGANEVYDPTLDTWTPLTPLPTPVGDTVALSHDNKIYVFGGFGNDGLVSNLVQIYDILTDSWSLGIPMPTARASLQGGTCGSNMHLIGGVDNDNFFVNQQTHEVYDPITDSWSSDIPIPIGTSEVQAVSTGNKIFIIGYGLFGVSGDANQIWNCADTTPPADISFDSPDGKYPLPGTAVLIVNDLSKTGLGPLIVTLSSPTDSIVVSLDETSTPGVFESAEISLVGTDSGASNELVVAENDSITASYDVSEDETIVAGATILPFGIVPSAFPGAPPSTTDPIRFVESNVYFVSQGATIRVTDATVPAATNSISVTVKSLVGSGPDMHSSLVLTATRDGPGLSTFTTSPLLSFAVVSSNPSLSILALQALPAQLQATYSGTTFVASATVINDPSNQPINPSFVPDTAIREVCASSDPDNGADSDGDGICDLWEIATGASAGLRIPTTQSGEYYTLSCVPGRTYTQDPSGATVCPVIGKPDLYLEIDCMEFQCPSQTAVNNVVEAFRTSPVRNAQGTIVSVQVHAFIDDTQIPRQQFLRFADPFNTIAEPTYQDLHLQYFGSNSERTQCNNSLPACVDQIERMLTAKRQVFRSGLFAIQQFDNQDSSGYGERPGNQFLVTLFPFTGHAGSIGQQAATLMHELGHTLSLRHGGGDDINYKPNHPSVINYLYQFDIADGGLVSRPLDFSRSTYTTINEASLSDGSRILGVLRNIAVGGIGNSPLITTTGTPIDWNRVSGTQTGYSKNVHHFSSLGGLDTTVYGPIPGTSLTGLRSQVDWNNLLFNVRFQSTFDSGMFTTDGFDDGTPVDGGVVALTPSKDSYLRKIFSNTNEGDNKRLLVAYLGSYRSLVAFEQPQIADAAQGKTLESAKLNLYIDFNFNDWGTGRDIEARPLLSSWTEGNGYNEFIPIPKVGTGSGVTWNCATDSNISNYRADCSSKWNGGQFGSSTSKVKITNGMSGWISLDVTSDVQAFLDGAKVNNGWIIKKVDEKKLGLVSFSSSEASSNRPELVLTFAP